MIQNGIILDENDDMCLIAEEGNEEYSSDASVFSNVNQGYLYIIIRNNSNYNISLTLNTYHF